MGRPPRDPPLPAGLGSVGVVPPPRDCSRLECSGATSLAEIGPPTPSLAPGICLPVARCAWTWFSSSSEGAFTALGFIGGDGDVAESKAVALVSGDTRVSSSPTRSAAAPEGDAFLRDEVLLGVTATARRGGGVVS